MAGTLTPREVKRDLRSAFKGLNEHLGTQYTAAHQAPLTQLIVRNIFHHLNLNALPEEFGQNFDTKRDTADQVAARVMAEYADKLWPTRDVMEDQNLRKLLAVYVLAAFNMTAKREASQESKLLMKRLVGYGDYASDGIFPLDTTALLTKQRPVLREVKSEPALYHSSMLETSDDSLEDTVVMKDQKDVGRDHGAWMDDSGEEDESEDEGSDDVHDEDDAEQHICGYSLPGHPDQGCLACFASVERLFEHFEKVHLEELD